MKKQRTIPPEEAERCIELRKRAKKGERLSVEESKFCWQMLMRFPDWYCSLEERVFNETVPFGSTAKFKRQSRDK